MRARFLVMFAAMAVLMVFAGPASADPSDNPNSIAFTYYCEDGSEYEAILVPGMLHDAEGNGILAVPFSAYWFESAADAAAGPEGGELAGYFGRGIHAQGDRLTWCWWNPFDTEGWWVGNELMFVGNSK